MGSLSDIKHVVILMQENRSFDEYFGTFPGATGFSDGAADGIFDQQGFAIAPGGLTPYRMSTFTASGIQRPGHAHDWGAEHAFWNNQQINGWHQVPPNPYPNDPQYGVDQTAAVMGYYAADDIPYHWALASKFALCDHYFCSALAGTATNRLYLMSGCIQDPHPPSPLPAGQWVGPATDNPPLGQASAANPHPPYSQGFLSWQTYTDMLDEMHVTWKVYDESYFPPPWPTTSPAADNGWGGMNVLDLFASDRASANFSKGYGNFEADAASRHLPAVSWLIPFFGLSEWEVNHPGDGAYNLALKLNALLENPDEDYGGLLWDHTVFILVYDENDGHFDHVAPPIAPQGADWFDAGNGLEPAGCGFRVPAIIISPWTLGGGVKTATFDHTSILQLLEQIPAVGAPCPNIPLWRRPSTSGGPADSPFGNLSSVFDFTSQPAAASAVFAQLPTPDEVLQFKASAEVRYSALGYTDLSSQTATAPPPMPPQSPSWPPVAQACELIMTFPSYGQGQVQDQAGLQGSATGPAAFDAAITVVVYGFESAELSTPYASAQRQPLQVAGTGTSIRTRVPKVTIMNAAGTVLTNDGGPLTVSPTTIDSDPTVDLSLPQPNAGVPRTFTFTYSLTFNDNPSNTALFTGSGVVETFYATATFQVDTTVTSAAELELVSTDDPQFYHNFYEDTSWLSGELRVFSFQGGQSLFGVPLGMQGNGASATSADALQFIQDLITRMNDAQTPGGMPLPPTQFQGTTVRSFDDLNQEEDTFPLSLTVTPPGQIPTYHFALARVHMQGEVTAPKVRVFFRSFRASVTSTAYEPTTNATDMSAYRSYPFTGPGQGPDDTKVPLLGVLPVVGQNQQTENEYVTIPFFASERLTLDPSNPSVTMRDQLADSWNVRDIAGSLGIAASQTFYGCWLDINQSQALFPLTFPAGTTNWDGPWTSGLASIQQAFKFDLHQCLVAEISFDPITIPTGDTPDVSAWLAQRNLGFTQS